MSQPAPQHPLTVRQLASRLPKPQLHLHLDGSLPEHLLHALAAKYDVPLPAPPSRLRRHFLSLKAHAIARSAYVQPPAGNWHAFDFCNALLRTPADLHHATRTVLNHLAEQRVTLAEIRFCPTLYSFSPHAAVTAVTKAFTEHGLRGGIILCALRSHQAAHVTDIISLAHLFRHRGVVAIDLAGDEATYPLSLHAQSLSRAVQSGLNLTVHAGEWGPHAEQNLRTALDLGAQRVGHALVLRQPELCPLMRNVFVETCITANCTGAHKVAHDQYHLHPVKQMLQEGVKVAAFNCDNLLLSGTLTNRPSPIEEIVRAKLGCGLSWRQIEQVLVNGVKASFDETVFVKNDRGDSFLESYEREVHHILKDFLQHDDVKIAQ